MTSRRVDRFDEAVRSAEQKCAELLASRSYQQNKMPQAMPGRGVYLFSEKGHMLYVGRSTTCARGSSCTLETATIRPRSLS